MRKETVLILVLEVLLDDIFLEEKNIIVMYDVLCSSLKIGGANCTHVTLTPTSRVTQK